MAGEKLAVPDSHRALPPSLDHLVGAPARTAPIAAGHLQLGTGDAAVLKAKVATARYYAEWLLPDGEPALALAAEQVRR